MNGPSERKRALRGPAREARRIAAAAAGPRAALAASQNFLRQISSAPGQVVAGYWPTRHEIDPRPLLVQLAAAGMAIALPAVEAPGRPLIFRLWPARDGGLPTPPPGLHDIPAPGPDSAAAIPHILLVPLLAFDAQGWRLGSGMGYYDRSIEALRRVNARTLAVGYAYAAQEVAEVPHDELDQRLDWVVTEKTAIRTRPERAK